MVGKKKKEKKEKNFCEACGLYITLVENTKEEAEANEKYFQSLVDLGIRGKGKFGRDISMSTSGPSIIKFCALGNKLRSKKGKRKLLWMEKRCSDFQPKLRPLELSDYIAIRTANKNSKAANLLTGIAILIALIGLALIIFGL